MFYVYCDNSWGLLIFLLLLLLGCIMLFHKFEFRKIICFFWTFDLLFLNQNLFCSVFSFLIFFMEKRLGNRMPCIFENRRRLWKKSKIREGQGTKKWGKIWILTIFGDKSFRPLFLRLIRGCSRQISILKASIHHKSRPNSVGELKYP